MCLNLQTVFINQIYMYLNIFQFLLCALLINFSNAFGAANAGFSMYDLALAAHDQKKGCAVVYDACNINYNIRTFKDGDSLLAIAYDRANHTFVGMPLDNSGAVSYIDTSKSPVPLPSGIKTPSEPEQMPEGNFAFDSSNKDKVWHKKPTELVPNRDYNRQSAKEVVFIGREVGSNFDKNWVATYIDGVTFVSELNTSLQHAILVSGNVKKPVIGVETTPNTTGTTFLEKLRSPAPTPNAGFLVQLPVPVISSEQKQNTAEKLQPQTNITSAKLATAKISNSNANNGNDDEQPVTSSQKPSKQNANSNPNNSKTVYLSDRDKKEVGRSYTEAFNSQQQTVTASAKSDTAQISNSNPNNSKTVYLSDRDQKEIVRSYTEAFQNITASAFATFGNTPTIVQEILDGIDTAQSTAITVAEFKNYVDDAKKKFKKLVDQHNQAQLQEAQAKRDALIAAMQPVIADETAAREKLAATLQQEITDSLANIFQQAKQEKEAFDQSPAHQKYVADQLAAKARLEFCENVLKESRTASNKIIQEYQEFMKNIAAAVYDINVELLVRNENGVVICLTDCKSAKKSSIQNVLFHYRKKINYEAKLLCVAKNKAELMRICQSFAGEDVDLRGLGFDLNGQLNFYH